MNKIVLAAPIPRAPAAAPGRRRVVLWGALALVAIAVVYAGVRAMAPGRAQQTAVADRASRVPQVEQLGLESESDPADSEARQMSGKGNNAGSSRPPAPAQKPTRAQAGARPSRGPANAVPGGGASAPAERNAGDTLYGNSAAGTGPDPETPTQLARATGPQTATAGDDGNALASALEKCGDEKFLAGVICEQKARLRYCDGKWGQVPQCTAKPRAD